MTSIIRLGRLVRDPEQKDVNGKSLTKFTVVEDSSRKDQSGKPYAVFVNCTMWGKGGDTIMQYVKKGDPVSLVGEFYQREYTTKDGEKRLSNEFDVQDFKFVHKPKGDEGAEQSAVKQESAPLTNADEDELPF